MVTKLAISNAWYEKNKDNEIGKQIQEIFPDEPLLPLSKFPQSKHCLLRWPIFWLGRTMMFFGVNFLKQDVAKLVPDDILDAANLAKFQAEFIEVLYYFPEIMAHLARAKDTPGYMAYGHPNLNVDNGFFFQGLDGNSIEMGGLDWGGYGKMGANVFLSGAISNSEDNQYNDRHEQLCRLYCSEFSKHSGVQLSGDQVRISLSFAFSLACMFSHSLL